jgi:FtsZ-interacting cell division protein ZipA
MSLTLIIWIIAIVAILAIILWYFLSASKKKGKISPKAPFKAPENNPSQGGEDYSSQEKENFPR